MLWMVEASDAWVAFRVFQSLQTNLTKNDHRSYLFVVFSHVSTQLDWMYQFFAAGNGESLVNLIPKVLIFDTCSPRVVVWNSDFVRQQLNRTTWKARQALNYERKDRCDWWIALSS
jgi:hypothetical protein